MFPGNSRGLTPAGGADSSLFLDRLTLVKSLKLHVRPHIFGDGKIDAQTLGAVEALSLVEAAVPSKLLQ